MNVSTACFIQMEKTVEIEDNPKILEELKMFSKCMSSDHLFDGADGYEVLLGASEGGYFRNPLERLGLFIKDDYTSDDDTEDEVILQGDKEGEIFL